MPWGRSSPPQVEFYVCHCRVSKLVHGTGNGTVVAQIEQILNNGGTGLNITKAMANIETTMGTYKPRFSSEYAISVVKDQYMTIYCICLFFSRNSEGVLCCVIILKTIKCTDCTRGGA